ncbi:MAG: methylenetetrahydrofolate reductase [NAD(P)H] [Planctomycetota bacterium]
MHIRDIFSQQRPTFSFEFFPPKTESSAQALYENISELTELKPTFVSVTYGAGGSTRELTHDLVVRLRTDTPLDPVPHLTCVCQSESEIGSLLERYAEAGISNVLALRGDVPADRPGHCHTQDDFQYASKLVEFIKGFSGHPDPRGFGIGVAGFPEGHPGCPDRLAEMDNLKAKVDAGADYIVTQLFFDNRDFFDFRDRCRLAGIDVPIIAGIMPITSANGMRRMAQLAAGARYPAPLLRAIARAGDDAECVQRVGVHWATEQCRDLLENDVCGIHFYTLNKSLATREIYASLGVKDSHALAS